MKKFLLLIVGLILVVACSNDNYSYTTKYLPNYGFSIDIDMSLPLYTDLLYTGNAKKITVAGIGINGVIVMNTGSGYAAWEASCPNQELSNCSGMTVNGVNAVCPCDNVQYSLFTGQATTAVQYPLKPYRVQVVSQNVIRVYN